MRDKTLIPEIVTLLVPHLSTTNQRRTELDLLFVGEPRRPDIELEGPPRESVQRLVLALFEFGALQDGRSALAALLEQIRERTGENQQPVFSAAQARVEVEFKLRFEVNIDPLDPRWKSVINGGLVIIAIIIVLGWIFSCSGRTEDIGVILDLGWKILVPVVVLFGIAAVLKRLIQMYVVPFLKTLNFTLVMGGIIMLEVLLLSTAGVCATVPSTDATQTPTVSADTPTALTSTSSASEQPTVTTAPSTSLRLVWTSEQLTLRLPEGAARDLMGLTFLYEDATGIERPMALTSLFAPADLERLNTVDCLRVTSSDIPPSLIPQCETTRTRQAVTTDAFWTRGFSVTNGRDDLFICNGNGGPECTGEYRP